MSANKSTRTIRGIDKMPTGIDGFDEITLGGLPRRRVTLLVGAPGTGKTVFALQTLVNGARLFGEPGIFVAFEEQSEQLTENAATFGWDLPKLTEERLFFLDARVPPDTVQAGDFDLIGMLASVAAKAGQMGARRIVFDSLDVLLTLLDNPLAQRQEVYRLEKWLIDTGLTAIITTRPWQREGAPFEFLQYMADCVVLLQQAVVDQVAVRDVRVIKYRGTAFTQNEFPMDIGANGVDVIGISPVANEIVAEYERVSTGIPRLDTMLNGGYYRGNSVLITGSPGTAKSTLTGAFAEAACARGERTLYVSFDESSSEIVRNLASVNIQLMPHVASGMLTMYFGQIELQGPGKHLIALRELIRDIEPHCLVIDPLSAVLKTGEALSGQRVAQSLLRLAKSLGITIVCTSLVGSGDAETEATTLNVSTIADTWIHLSYLVRGGERNRALTIVKARGTAHSNQVRELVLSEEGVTLADVYSMGGEVLMGTLRYEREAVQDTERQRARDELERQRLELDAAEAEARYQLEALKANIALRRAALEQLERQQANRERGSDVAQEQRRQMRGADADRSGAEAEAEADASDGPGAEE